MSRILAEHLVDMVSTHERDGTFRYASSVLAGMVGEYPGWLKGKHPRDFAHPDDATALIGLFRRALDQRGTTAYATWRIRRHDGQYAWLETSARATPLDARDLGDIVCGSRDITERKQIEDALRDSEQRFRMTLETVRLVAIGLDTEGRVTFINEALQSLTGWTRADLIGENWFDLAVPADDPSRTLFYERIASGDIPAKFENEILCRDGSRRTIEWDSTVLRTPDGAVAGVASLGADVTVRRQEEATLKLLQEITLQVSAARNLRRALIAALESVCEATGWGCGEVWLPTESGEHLERVTAYVVPGVDASALVAAGEQIRFAPGEGLPGRAWQSRQVEWVPALDELDDQSRPRLRAAAQAGFRVAAAIPVMSGTDVVGVLGFFMDRARSTDARHTQMVSVIASQVGIVIERRRAQRVYEAEILRARDEAQAASVAKSEFLSRMSHELRTPLNSVIGFAGILKKNKSGRLTEEELTFINRIISNGKHLLALVNDVLDISKVEAGRITVTTGLVSVEELVQDVVAQVEGMPRAPGVALRAEVNEAMVPLETDGVLMKQVLINLVGNALRFTREGSVVVGAVGNDGVPESLYVRDTGIGIPPERQQAIFEPFEQAAADTHRTYGGTGLGLSISRAICETLGYRLTLESEVGKGSTFTVHLARLA